MLVHRLGLARVLAGWRVSIEEAVAAGMSAVEMRRQARALCWREGDLSYSLRPVQLRGRSLVHDAISRRVRRIVWNWGRRLGKSHGAVVLALETAIARPGARIPYAAPTQKMVGEFVHPIFTDLAQHAPAELRPALVDGEWRMPEGRRIIPVGCEDKVKADRLRGPKADAAIVDEGGFIPILDYVVQDVLRPQLLTTQGWMLIASTPPETPAHPFVRFMAEAEARGAYMHASVRESDLISPEEIDLYCDELGGPTSSRWLREGEARIVVDETRAVLPEWQGLEAAGRLVLEVPHATHFDAYVAADLGYLDLTVVLFGWWDFLNARLVIEDELVLERTTSAEIQRLTAAKERELWGGRSPFRRVADASLITVADMRALQRQVEDDDDGAWTPPRKDDKEAAINALRVGLTRGQVVVHPRCRTLIAHARHAIWNARRTEFERSADDGHFDAVDALLYMWRAVVREKNPFPEAWDSADRTTQHVFGGMPKAKKKDWFAPARRRV